METKIPFYARLALTLIAFCLSMFVLAYGSGIFIPLTFALLISVLMYPFCNFLERKFRFPRVLASLVCVILFISFIAGFIYFISLQVVNFSDQLPHVKERLAGILSNCQHWISAEYHINSKQQMDYLNKSGDGVVSAIGNIFLGFSVFTLWIIFIFIYTFFMLYHRRLLLRFVLHLFRTQHRAQVNDVVNETRGMINSYVLGLVTEILILCVLNSTVLTLLGIPYAILLGVIAAVLNIIPYLGIYTGMALGMFVTFANSSGSQAIQLGIAFLIIHFIDANILMPRIVGARVKMNPLITIITVLAGHLIWGIAGMFLFIPIMGIIKIISERVDSLKAWAILIGVEEKP